MNELQELTYDEMVDANGGFAQIAAAGVAAGLPGFGVGLLIGVALTAGVIYLMK